LAALAVAGFGVWIFLRKRAMLRGSDQGFSDYTKVSTGAPMSEHGHGKQPPQLRLYVRLFVILSGFRSDRRF
jgi:hypothetical protein